MATATGSGKGRRSRLDLERIERESRTAERLGEALEQRGGRDGAWNEPYATPTKKPKPPAGKRYPAPKTR